MARKKDVETTVREIRRKTRKKYSAEEKIRIVLEGFGGEGRSRDGPWSKDACTVHRRQRVYNLKSFS